MNKSGVKIDRPVAPTSIELSVDESSLNDPNAHPVQVEPLVSPSDELCLTLL